MRTVQVFEQIGAGGLAVGSRDGDDREVEIFGAEAGRGQNAELGAHVGNEQPGMISVAAQIELHALHGALGSHDGPGPLVQRHADVACGLAAFPGNGGGKGHKDIAFGDETGIGLNGAELFTKLVAELGRGYAHGLTPLKGVSSLRKGAECL